MAKKRDPARPSQPTIKRLFAHSGNRCAFPGCTATLIDGDTVVGKVCHIKGARPRSARYDAQQSASERHGCDNLILMCGRHHDVIDADDEAYTIDRVLKMKADHESHAAHIDDNFAEHATHLLINQPVTSVNQSGGITAHTVDQTFNVSPSNESAGGSGEPRPDWPIRDLFYHVRPAGFSTRQEKDTVGREVLDRFSDGQLRVWGRLIENSKRRSLAEIPKDQWQRANFGSYWFLDEGDNSQVLHAICETPSRGAAPHEYADLQVSRAQATSIWTQPQRISVLDFLTAAEADGWVFLGKRLAMHKFAHGLREAGLQGPWRFGAGKLKRIGI